MRLSHYVYTLLASLRHKPFLHILKQHKQRRNNKKQSHRAHEHSTHRTYTYGYIAISTNTRSKHHG